MIRNRFTRALTVFVVLLVLMPIETRRGALAAESDVQSTKANATENADPAFKKNERQRWTNFYRKEAATYEFAVGTDEEKKLYMQPEPVLLYTNPVGDRGLTHGAVFVWSYKGRSEVIGAIWSHANTPEPNQRSISHEFHSLSDEPLTAKRSGTTVWSTDQPGVRWISSSRMPRPAVSKSGRLVQMRSLTRDLSVTRHDPKDDSLEYLRHLPNPVYRYDDATATAKDGAVFAYCVVWDPEAFVAVETRQTDDGLQWQYAPVRVSHLTLAAHDKKVEAWRDVRSAPSHRDPALGYKLFYKTSVQSELLDP